MQRIKPYLENKYHVSSVNKYVFLHNFKNVIVADENTKDGHYFVSSIYFDTDNFDFFLDKLEGEFFKLKIRIRRYSHDKISWSSPRLELKMKVAEETIKVSKWISNDEFLKLTSTPVSGYEILKILDWDKKSPVDFLVRRLFKPVTEIIYDRDAFSFVGLPGLRLTFDHDIKSKKFNSNEYVYLSEINNIFEIKSDIKMPLLFSEWLKSRNITQEHLSKYSLAIEKLYNFS